MLDIKKALMGLTVIIGAILVLFGLYAVFSDLPMVMAWKPTNAVVTHFNDYTVPDPGSKYGVSHVLNITYSYTYEGSNHTGRCCGVNVAPSLIQFENETGGENTGNIVGSWIPVVVNPDSPGQSQVRAAIMLPDYFIAIVIGVLMPVFVYYGLKSSAKAAIQSTEKTVGVVTPFADANGFKKVAVAIDYPYQNSNLEGFQGSYRNRDFEIALDPSLNRIYIVSPNKSKREINMPYLDYKKIMEEQGMSDIYKRMEDMRVLNQIWGRYFYPVNINRSTVFFGLTEWAYSASDFKDFVDLLCDLMDRLGI